MKFVLLFTLAFCLTACSSSDNSTSNNQKTTSNLNTVNVTVNVNNSAPNVNSSQNISVNNTANNSVQNNSNQKQQSNLNEKITIKGGETVKVKGTELSLKVVTVATASIPSNTKNTQSSAATIPLCRVEATLNGKTEGQQLYYNQPGRNEFIFEGFKIHLQNITPTGTVDCTLVVTKN